MQHDTHKIGRAIALTHPAVGSTVTRLAIAEMTNNLAEKLPEKASVREYIQLIEPLLDTVQCGHLSIRPTGYIAKAYYQKPDYLFPLSLKLLDDETVVIEKTLPGADTNLLGDQILELDHRPIEDWITEAMALSAGSDGSQDRSAKVRALASMSMYLNWVSPDQTSFAVRLKRRNATADTSFQISAFQPKQNKEYQYFTFGKPIGYGFDSIRRTAVIDINSLMGYDPFNVTYSMVLHGVFAKAKRDKAEHLILDLRGNSGGRASNVNKILSYLVEEKTRIFNSWTYPKTAWRYSSSKAKLYTFPSFVFRRGEHREFGQLIRKNVRPRKNGFTGEVYVLIDAWTFSAASITASVLKSSGRAQLLGQEAGGNYHQTYAGIFSTIPLRHTGLKLNMPHFLIPVAVDPSKQSFDKTLQPDIFYPTTVEDVLDPRDLILLQALEKVIKNK